MNSQSAIRAEGVSKKYCKDLKRSMLYGLADIARNAAGRPARSERLRKSEFWALNEVSFEIRPGERLGVIGPNGSGKTTLLKLLNGIFWPDRGRIAIRGRVGALIEVGAGFHPLLTGRENIHLNGAILGMSRREVEARFDAIVEFAGIGEFIDTPVKYYSSGMFVRLGFSVAAHCEPEILLIDEVLAVGDIAFQSLCYRKIAELKDRGVTIVFVSHSMRGVRLVCDRALYLRAGMVRALGASDEVISAYSEEVHAGEAARLAPAAPEETPFPESEASITEVAFTDGRGNPRDTFETGGELRVRIGYRALRPLSDVSFSCSIYASDKTLLATEITCWDGLAIPRLEGEGVAELVFDAINLLPGAYLVSIGIGDGDGLIKYARRYQAHAFRIAGAKIGSGKCHLPHRWILPGA